MATATARDDRRRRGAAAAAAFAVIAPITYVGLRLFELARSGHVDPSLILRSTHVGYLWRVTIATWWALTCAFVVYGRGWSAPARRIGVVAASLTAIVALLSVLYP